MSGPSLTLIQLDDLETAVINNDPLQREHVLAAIRMARTLRGQEEASTPAGMHLRALDSAKPQHEMCKCGKNPAQPDHPCPYQQEINDENRDVCVCCNDCMHECAMDI